MPSIKKILFPVDFSQRSECAARYVESLAGRFEAEIMLLHVIDYPVYDSLDTPSAQERLDWFLAGDFRPFSVRRVSVVGDPSEEIAKMEKSWAPDLIMMPSYGLGFFRPELLGSVTAKALQDTNCPIWTSVHSDSVRSLEGIACRRILCAVDCDERSRRVLEWARFVAGEYQADLRVVHATALPDLPLLSDAKGRLDALLASVGFNVKSVINSGEPGKTIAAAASEFGADLVVIGRHESHTDGDYLRDNAHAIIRRSPCPVVSI